MVETVKAITFVKAFRSGRTRPFLMLCADRGGNEIEVVVKLISGTESTKTGLVCELITSLLARDLDLPVPQPVLVEIDMGFHGSISDVTFADRFRNSVGLSFGSKFLGPGYVTWPQERSIPGPLMQDAADIFAFDLLIQNPDRRKDRPNLLCRRDELAIFDHELAFSFLYSIVPDALPWEGKGLDFAQDHVFYSGLRGHTVEWDRMQGAFEAIDNSRLEAYTDNIPDSWRNEGNDSAQRIHGYLMEARVNSKKLFKRIREALT